jgi:NAD(P)H-dependent FMN reductase/ketosteroid isomerase-like protein
MSQPLRVAVLTGSLRAGALSRKIADALIERAPVRLRCNHVAIAALPLYNADLEQDPPAAWSQFRAAIRDADAVLFVTPEYNRSIPGGLKNALDVGSRPSGQSAFDGKPAAVVSVTPYGLGGFGANHALRQTFAFLNMPVLQQPEAYISRVNDVLDDTGNVKDPETSRFFEKLMSSFAAWIELIGAGSPHAFEAFMRQRHEVAADYVRGDSAALAAILTQREPATFFSPKGDALQGAAAVAERYAADAQAFIEGGKTRLDVLQSGASGKLAFWTGIQHAEVVRRGETVPITLRVTEIFRFEEGAYKLVHRHADPSKG